MVARNVMDRQSIRMGAKYDSVTASSVTTGHKADLNRSTYHKKHEISLRLLLLLSACVGSIDS